MHQEVRGSVGGQRDGWVDRGVVKRIWQTVNIGSGVQPRGVSLKGSSRFLFVSWENFMTKYRGKCVGHHLRPRHSCKSSYSHLSRPLFSADSHSGMTQTSRHFEKTISVVRILGSP